MIDEANPPVTLEEKYAKAAMSSNLRPSGERRAWVDYLAAVAIAASRSKERDLSVAIHRMLATGDASSLPSILEACNRWLGGYLVRKGKRPMSQHVRVTVVRAALAWAVDHRCAFCGGTGVMAAEGTGGRLTSACDACHGSGSRPLSSVVPRSHIEAAQWLLDRVGMQASQAFGEAARWLAKDMEL